MRLEDGCGRFSVVLFKKQELGSDCENGREVGRVMQC